MKKQQVAIIAFSKLQTQVIIAASKKMRPFFYNKKNKIIVKLNNNNMIFNKIVYKYLFKAFYRKTN